MIMIDIDMPDNCDECRFNTEYGFCKAMPDNFCGNTDDRKRPNWCPLKEQEAVEPKEETDPNESHWNCGACGYPLWEDENYCAHCGKRVLWEGW